MRQETHVSDVGRQRLSLNIAATRNYLLSFGTGWASGSYAKGARQGSIEAPLLREPLALLSQKDCLNPARVDFIQLTFIFKTPRPSRPFGQSFLHKRCFSG